MTNSCTTFQACSLAMKLHALSTSWDFIIMSYFLKSYIEQVIFRETLYKGHSNPYVALKVMDGGERKIESV